MHATVRTEVEILICFPYQYIITYPISEGKFINTVALVSKPELNGTIYDGPLVEAVSRDELLNNFFGWEPQVQTLLNVRHTLSRFYGLN